LIYFVYKSYTNPRVLQGGSFYEKTFDSFCNGHFLTFGLGLVRSRSWKQLFLIFQERGYFEQCIKRRQFEHFVFGFEFVFFGVFEFVKFFFFEFVFFDGYGDCFYQCR